MSWVGRARWLRGLSPLVCLFTLINHTASSDYGIPIEIQLWDTGRTPLAHMVDVTNEFALKVLAEHNFLNDNNIAFSPYGLTGIMVALYEGIDGESSYQIQRGMQMPWNRNVMRIGFRDIHRTLKTYFVPEEGFLAGLALNNENVTFNDSYKKVLRFYGFDLEKDQPPTLPPQSNSTVSNDTPSPTSMPDRDTPGDGSPTTAAMPETPAREDKEETTLNPNAETIPEVDVREPTTTAAPAAATDALVSTSETDTPAPSTQQAKNTEQAENAENTVETTLASTSPPSSTNAETAEATKATTTIETTQTTVTQQEPRDTSDVENIGTLESTANTAALTTLESTTASGQETTETATNEEITPTTEQIMTMTDNMTLLPDSTMTTNESALETLTRKKKSLVDFIFTRPPYVDDYLIYRSFDIPPELPSVSFSGDGQKMFLANGLRNVHVSYMKYDSVLEHAYLPHLEASALRLPLDSDRYYLLVILPNRPGATELSRLIARMARESDLRDVYGALRQRRVRAIVPSFTVKGHVTLTTDLQKLGIRDVFEPRQRDFTPMTAQSGVYVRSVEQAVSVAIRKYRPDDQKKNRYVTGNPVPFSATYPFIYFVMDASVHVSLMAGKMVDPLNNRIL